MNEKINFDSTIFSIVIPAYNEEKRIKPVLDDISDFIRSNNLSWEVIIVIEGNDNTEKIVNYYHENFPFISSIKLPGRNGMGNAIKKGILASKGDYIILMDADNSAKISDMINKVKDLERFENYDIINFDRYSLKENNIPFKRRFPSRGFNFILRAIFKIDVLDTQCDYKIMKKSAVLPIIDKITIKTGFFLSAIFIYAKKMKLKIIEIPLPYHHTENGKIHVILTTVGHLLTIIAFMVRHSRFYKYIPDWARSLYYRKFRGM